MSVPKMHFGPVFLSLKNGSVKKVTLLNFPLDSFVQPQSREIRPIEACISGEKPVGMD